jgi:hypothetical protein
VGVDRGVVFAVAEDRRLSTPDERLTEVKIGSDLSPVASEVLRVFNLVQTALVAA